MSQTPFYGADEVYDLSAECIDVSLRVITDSQVLDDVPIAGNLLKIVKAGASVKDYLFLRKVSKFFSHVNEKMTSDQRSKFAEELRKDKRKRETLYEYIFLFIDNLSEISKAEISAKVFSSFARQKIRIEELKSLYHGISQVSTTNLADFSFCFFADDLSFSSRVAPPGKVIVTPELQISSLIPAGFIEWKLKNDTKVSFDTIVTKDYAVEHQITELGMLYAFIAEDLEDFFEIKASTSKSTYTNKNYVFPDYTERAKLDEISEILRVKWNLPPKNS